MSVIALLLFGSILIAAGVAVVLLLANPRTRTVTLSLLAAGCVAIVLLLGGVLFFRASTVVSPPAHIRQQVQSPPYNGNSGEIAKQYETVMESYMGQGAAPSAPDSPTSPPTPPAKKSPSLAEAAPKDEDDLSQAVATKTVGMLRAMVRALGRALVEEEKILATKKDGTKPAAPVPGKPDWVEAPPKLLADDSYQMSFVVGPYTSRAECEAQVPEALQKALDDYVEMAIGPEAVGMVQLPAEILRQEIYRASWEETRSYSVGPMIRLHGRLQFDRPFKTRVQEAYREAIVAERLRTVGVWAALGLSLLTVCFAYLKADLATGGTRRGRLRLGAAAVILMGLIAAAVAVIA
jgi:hypothetical protein